MAILLSRADVTPTEGRPYAPDQSASLGVKGHHHAQGQPARLSLSPERQLAEGRVGQQALQQEVAPFLHVRYSFGNLERTGRIG